MDEIWATVRLADSRSSTVYIYNFYLGNYKFSKLYNDESLCDDDIFVVYIYEYNNS